MINEDQNGKSFHHSKESHSLIIFVFKFVIIFHDYNTKKNRYLHKNDLEIKEFSCCIGISRDFVAIGTGDGLITMFKLSEWSIGRLLSKGYHTKTITCLDLLIRYGQSYIISASSDGLWAVWAPFSSVGTPQIKYQGFKGESFNTIEINRLEETVLWVGTNCTLGVWNIKDGTELYKVRGIKSQYKTTITNFFWCYLSCFSSTKVFGFGKDSTLELVETSSKALLVPK